MSSSSTDSPCVDSGNVTACTTSSVVTQTVVEATQVEEGTTGPTLKLRLVPKEKKGDKPDNKKPEGRRGVSWTTDTVDNEHMNKKKSKCCCIYVKPKKFGESDTESSDEDDECPDHCGGPHRKKQ